MDKELKALINTVSLQSSQISQASLRLTTILISARLHEMKSAGFYGKTTEY